MKKFFIMLIMLSGVVGCARNSSTGIVDNGESKARIQETASVDSEIDTQTTVEHISEEIVVSTPIKYTSTKDGFTVLLPSYPTVTNLEPTNDTQVRAYEAHSHDGLAKYYVFCNIFEKKILSDESIRAFLDGHLQGRLLVEEKGRVTKNTSTEFRGFDAQEFEYTNVVEDVEFVHKGVAFLIDGDSMSLTMVHPKELEPEFTFDEFTDSFELLPLEPILSPDYWVDESLGLRFAPPADMSNLNRERGRNGLIVMFANKAGHSIGVFDVTLVYPNITWSDIHRELSKMKDCGDGYYENIILEPATMPHMVQLMKYVGNGDRIYMIQGYAPQKTYFRSVQKFKEAMKSLSFGSRSLSSGEICG